MQKIKKREKSFSVTEGGRPKLQSEKVYNTKGQLIWEQHLFPSGDILSESEFEYVEYLLIREKSWNELGRWTEIKYAYDEAGELVQRTTIDEDENELIFTITKNTFKIVELLIDQEGLELQKEVMQLDNEGNIVKKQFYEDGVLVETHAYEHTLTNEISAATISFKNVEGQWQTSRTTYTYSEDDNYILEVQKNEDYVIIRQSECFYQNDLLIKEIQNGFTGSAETLITVYEYDAKERIIKEITTTIGGRKVKETINIYSEDDTVIQTYFFQVSPDYMTVPQKSQTRTEIEYY